MWLANARESGRSGGVLQAHTAAVASTVSSRNLNANHRR